MRCGRSPQTARTRSWKTSSSANVASSWSRCSLSYSGRRSDPFDERADGGDEQRHRDQRRDEPDRPPDERRERHGQEGADHVERAVRDVHDPERTEDQGESRRRR
jgi:hypothetical protein